MPKCTILPVLAIMVLLNSNIQEACNDPSFYCELVNGRFHLKHNHQYYYQVQLQLYVITEMFSWSDFCVYTPVDISYRENISM